MSGQTPGQGEDGDAHTSQQSDTPLPGRPDAQETHEGNIIQESAADTTQEVIEITVEPDDSSGDYNDGDVHDQDELPARPSSRLDFSSDEEGNPIASLGNSDDDDDDRKALPSRQRVAISPTLSRISEGSSNKTDQSVNVVQGTGEGATMQPVTKSGRNNNSNDNNEPDNDADQSSITQDDGTMESVADARSHLFDSLLTRIREENLFTHPQSLIAAEMAATLPGQQAAHWWNPDDLHDLSVRHIEDFRRAMQRPRDDGTVLPVEVQNQMTEQLQGLAYVLRGDAVHWLTQGLNNDTTWMMDMTNSIDQLLADRPVPLPATRSTSTGSNASRPERTLPLLDPQRLRKLSRDELVDYIIKQDDGHRTELDQYEAQIGDLQQVNDQAKTDRDESEATLQKLVTVTQQLRQAAHQFGLEGKDIDGLQLQGGATLVRRDNRAEDEPEDQESYIHRIEGQLQDCEETHEKDEEKLKYLRLEIADLNANLATARAEARQACEQAHKNGLQNLNIEGTEPVRPLPGQRASVTSVSDGSRSSHGAGDGEPLRDVDAELEALRIEHEQELAKLKADCEKEKSDLMRDNAEDRRKAYENGQTTRLTIDGELLPGQGSLEGSISSETNERRESSFGRSRDNNVAKGVVPGLDSLLDALWGDDHDSAEFMAIADQQRQRQPPGQNVDEERITMQMTLDTEASVRQSFQDDKSLPAREWDTLAHTLTTTRRERDEARAEVAILKHDLEKNEMTLQATADQRDDAQEQTTNVTKDMQQTIDTAETERDRAKTKVSLLQEQAAAFQKSIDDAQTVLDEGGASQQILSNLLAQLRECQEHRVVVKSTTVADDPKQAVDLVERLLEVINELRQFAPFAEEIAQFAIVMVHAGRIDPATLRAELQLVIDSAVNVAWPEAEFRVTPEQREDIGQLAAALRSWLPTVQFAINNFVVLDAAVGSLRVAVDISNTLDLSKRDGSQARLSEDSQEGRGGSQANVPAGLPLRASITSSIDVKERGELLSVAAQIADQYTREQREVPIDETTRLKAAGAAADLYMRRYMGESPGPCSDEQGGVGEQHGKKAGRLIISSDDDDDDTQRSSDGGRRGSRRPDRHEPTYVDPTWLASHKDGRCKQCKPVLRFPVSLFPGGVDFGPCRCGAAHSVDEHLAESRTSGSSGTRSVAFSDYHGAPGGGAIYKSSRGILKKPRSLDTAGAKARGSVAHPKSPYPRMTQSAAGWNAAKLPSPRQLQRSQSTSSVGTVSGSFARQLSHDVSVPIMPVQKFCCRDYDELKRVCLCEGKCEDHWCCKHWRLTGECTCGGDCHTDANGSSYPKPSEEPRENTCCPCASKPGIVPKVCACDKTCRDHAVCEDYRAFKPWELSCMAGCDASKKDAECEHGGACRQTPCDSHPCCIHHVVEGGRAYCDCGKSCGSHVCCSHYLPGFKTCDCSGTCEDHLPVIPKHLRQHFRDVAAVAEAQTTPSALITDLYFPTGRMFPRQVGQSYDWEQVARANADLLRSLNLLGPNGEILVPGNAPAALGKGSPTPDERQAARVRLRTSAQALVLSLTSTAPATTRGVAQDALDRRSDPSTPKPSIRALRRAQGVQDAAGTSASAQVQPAPRYNALPDVPRPETGRLLSDGLLDFKGPQPTFDDGDDESDIKPAPVLLQRAACAHGRFGVSCNCRCRGDDYHVLTGPGGRFAFYTCDSIHGGVAEPSAVFKDDEDKDDTLNSMRAAGGLSGSASAEGSLNSSRAGDGDSKHSLGRRSGASSRQNSRQKSQGAEYQAGSRQDSRRSSTKSGLDQRPDNQQPGEQQPAEQEPDAEESQEQKTPEQEPQEQGIREQKPGNIEPVNGNPDDDRRGPDNDDPDVDGGDRGGLTQIRQPNRGSAPNPWRQIWDFTWFLIRFFTFGQIANLLAIVHFARNFVVFNGQRALHALHLAQFWQRLPNPRLPRAQLLSFGLWMLLMWQLTMLIALGEERRLWLAANPRTAAYVRGLQFRQPYPRWSPFEVDYALLEPALEGLSVGLHRLYFRPGKLGRMEGAVGAIVGAGQSVLQLGSYSAVEGALIHAKDSVVGFMAALWALILRMVSGQPHVPHVPSFYAGSRGNPGTPVIPVHPPDPAGPQVYYGRPAQWEEWWALSWDLLVRTVTGRRKVSHE